MAARASVAVVAVPAAGAGEGVVEAAAAAFLT